MDEPVTFRGVHNGHEQTYHWVRQFLRDLDFKEAAARLGFDLLSNDSMKIDFLGRCYEINRENVLLQDKEVCSEDTHHARAALKGVLDFNIRSILSYYAISQGSSEPENNFAPLSAMSHGVFSGGGSVLNNPRDRLSVTFGDDYSKFERAAAKLHKTTTPFVFEKSGGEGKYLWRYNLLPKVPINIAYYQGDDEFPTAIKVLFDKTALHYFKFEPLAVLNMCFNEVFAAVGADC